MSASLVLLVYCGLVASAATLWVAVTAAVWWQFRRVPMHPDDD